MKDWLQKYLIWILLGLIVILYIVVKFTARNRPKDEVVQKTLDKITALKQQKEEEHEAIVAKIEKKKLRLKEIKSIKNKEERLKALADYTNE